MKTFLKQIIGIEFYRNIPFVDQIPGTPFLKHFFHFQKCDMPLHISVWVEIPFIAAKIKIKKK